MSVVVQKKDETPKVEKKPISRKKAMLLTSVLSVLLLVAFVFLYAWPQWDRIGVNKEIDLDSLQSQLQQKQNTLSQLKKLKTNYEQIPPDEVQTLGVMLPDKALQPELLTQIEAIGRSSGVNVTSVNISEDVTTDTRTASQRLQAQAQTTQQIHGLRTLTVQLEVSAFSYENFKKFLENLQNNARLIDIQRYSYSLQNQKQTLLLKVYYLPSA